MAQHRTTQQDGTTEHNTAYAAQHIMRFAVTPQDLSSSGGYRDALGVQLELHAFTPQQLASILANLFIETAEHHALAVNKGDAHVILHTQTRQHR